MTALFSSIGKAEDVLVLRHTNNNNKHGVRRSGLRMNSQEYSVLLDTIKKTKKTKSHGYTLEEMQPDSAIAL